MFSFFGSGVPIISIEILQQFSSVVLLIDRGPFSTCWERIRLKIRKKGDYNFIVYVLHVLKLYDRIKSYLCSAFSCWNIL